jgi:hypothetical protein
LIERKSSNNSKDDSEDDLNVCTGCIIEIDSFNEGRPIQGLASGAVWNIGTDDEHLTLLIRHASGDINQFLTLDGRDIMLSHKDKHVSFKYNASLQAFEEVLPTDSPIDDSVI